MHKDFNIVILAGGQGTRFWPASKPSNPKQFLNILSDKPLILDTFLRVNGLTAKDSNIFIVINKEHQELTKEIFSNYNVNIILEPYSKNTAPCIGLTALYINKMYGNRPIVVLPSDHYIANVKAFRRSIEFVIKVLKENEIITIGVTPTRPETGYGYIKLGKRDSKYKSYNLYKVKQFIEKPNVHQANKFLQEGNYLWNCGIFAFYSNTILNEIKKYIPNLYDSLIEIEKILKQENYFELLSKIYNSIEPVSIDYGIIEKTDTPILALKSDFGWSDVGSWLSVYLLRDNDKDNEGNILDCKGVNLDCKNIFVFSRTNRLVSTLGLNNILIVDMPDSLLVADINKSQDIKKIVEELKKWNIMEIKQ